MRRRNTVMRKQRGYSDKRMDGDAGGGGGGDASSGGGRNGDADSTGDRDAGEGGDEGDCGSSGMDGDTGLNHLRYIGRGYIYSSCDTGLKYSQRIRGSNNSQYIQDGDAGPNYSQNTHYGTTKCNHLQYIGGG